MEEAPDGDQFLTKYRRGRFYDMPAINGEQSVWSLSKLSPAFAEVLEVGWVDIPF